MAVKTVEDELNEIYKKNRHQQTITISNNLDLESENSIKAYLPTSRRRLENRQSNRYEPPEKVSTEKISQLNEIYSNRLYQLASTLYTYNMKGEKKCNWEEIIEMYKKIVEIESQLQGNNGKIIRCLIFLANSYLEYGEHLASLKYLKEAESSLSVYERVEKLIQTQSNKGLASNMQLNIQETISQTTLQKMDNYKTKFCEKADILKQILLYHYGIFYKKVGRYKQACIMFTQSIEKGKVYDPHIRKKSLEALSNLLASQNLLQKAPNITNILSRMDDTNHKDILFLLDYSESMGKGARIQYAIRNFMKIFDKYIKDNDKIGFIRFNLNCEVVFALSYKKNNTPHLRQQIENSLNPSGKTAFYDALAVAAKQFHFPKQDSELKDKRRKWIVSLTDAEDNTSNFTIKKVKSLFKASDINLIIVGMGLSASLATDLKDLCKSTKDGVFIESPNNNDLDVAFESISQIIYGQNLIIESI